jgi:hypothetical protein
VNRPGRILLGIAFLAVTTAGSAEAPLPEQLQHWLQPLPNCRSLICIFRSIPNSHKPSIPVLRPWPISGAGPITTTPEPLTMSLVGIGLAGIGVVRRRKRRKVRTCADTEDAMQQRLD